jgi:hypothetical protein
MHRQVVLPPPLVEASVVTREHPAGACGARFATWLTTATRSTATSPPAAATCAMGPSPPSSLAAAGIPAPIPSHIAIRPPHLSAPSRQPWWRATPIRRGLGRPPHSAVSSRPACVPRAVGACAFAFAVANPAAHSTRPPPAPAPGHGWPITQRTAASHCRRAARLPADAHGGMGMG